jgi:Uma2 family endonuclease
MTSLFSPTTTTDDQRVVLSGVTWQQYETLLATLGDDPGLRLIYLEGTLEIFMPSSEHELLKKVLARRLERMQKKSISRCMVMAQRPFAGKPKHGG